MCECRILLVGKRQKRCAADPVVETADFEKCLACRENTVSEDSLNHGVCLPLIRKRFRHFAFVIEPVDSEHTRRLEVVRGADPAVRTCRQTG